MSRAPEEGRYSKITRRMWTDEKFRELSEPKPNAQTLWMRLLSGPELGIIPGLYAVREGGLADALGWPVADFRKCWKEIVGQAMAEADWRAGLVWVPNAIAHNAPNSTNAILGWRLALRELPECPLKRKALAELREYCAGMGEKWVDAFDSAASNEPKSSSRAVASAMAKPKPIATTKRTTSQTAFSTPSATSSATSQSTASGTMSRTQDQDQEQDTRIEDLAAAGSQDLLADPARAGEAAAAAGPIDPITHKYQLAQKNNGWFALENGVNWPEFREVWFAWCKPWGITEPPRVTQRIDRDITAIIDAFASGKSLDQLLIAGKRAETDEYMQRQENGGPASFTSAVLMRLLKPLREGGAPKRRGGPPQPDAGFDPFAKHDAKAGRS